MPKGQSLSSTRRTTKILQYHTSSFSASHSAITSSSTYRSSKHCSIYSRARSRDCKQNTFPKALNRHWTSALGPRLSTARPQRTGIMAGLTVLTDSDVQGLLRDSSEAEVSRFADILTQTLQQYSTTDEAEHQPHRAAVKRSSGQGTLFMPSTSPDYLGVKIVGLPPPQPKSKSSSQPGQKPPTLEATMTLCDATGKAVGVLNAAELTAFRTSLGAMLLFRYRKIVRNVVMFGSGKQAYWHLRLAIILRGADIETITIVNRSSQRAEELLESLKSDDLLKQQPHIKLSTLIPSDSDYDSKLKTTVTDANSIHCAVPSTEPLFPAAWLISESSPPRQDPYISAIGSYRLDMKELDPQLLKHVTTNSATFVSEGRETPVIVVDSRSGCFAEAGEVVDAGLEAKHLLEIGELSDLTRQAKEAGRRQAADLEKWLQSGLVVYKSVGIGVMDICIASALVELARDKAVGVVVPNF